MKILKPGPRPFIAFGTLFGLIIVLMLSVGIFYGKTEVAGRIAGGVFGLAVIILLPIATIRVEIDEDDIRAKICGINRESVSFDEIGYSFTVVVAEKDWPVSLIIIGKDGETELMSIGLKVFRKEDVSWLLAQPKLRIKENPE